MDEKQIKMIKDDLKLITQTAEVLATKLKKVTETINQMIDEYGVTGKKEKVEPKKQFTEIPRTEPAPAPEPRRTAETKKTHLHPVPEQQPVPKRAPFSESKTTRMLNAFLEKLGTMDAGSEIATTLSALRDEVMEAAETGFHPAFHEMGRMAQNLKHKKTISPDDKEELIEKVIDWKDRLNQ